MSEDAQLLYNNVCQHARRTALLGSIEEVLGWDERTKMPPAGAEHRAEQMTVLSGIIHQRRTDPDFGRWLAELSESPLAADPHGDSGTTIRRLKRQYDKRVKLPQSLVEELTRTAVLGQGIWQKARADNDFASFRPLLEKTIELKRQEAEALGYPECPYDALLDEFEPEALTAEVTRVLAGLRDELVPLVGEIGQSGREPDVSILSRRFPIDRQEAFGREVASSIGFDFNRGRLDVTAHPFCTGLGPNDCRITTRYDEHFFNSALLRHPARGRPRHLRPGAAGRSVRAAAGRGGLAGHPRIAVADVGEPGRPQPGLLAALLPQAQAAVPRSAGRRRLDDFYFADQRRAAVARSASRPTRRRTTCTS